MISTEKLVRQITSDMLDVPPEEIELDSDFKDDLGADSLDVVELIMEFEKQFNIYIPDEVQDGVNTVGQAITCIENLVGK